MNSRGRSRARRGLLPLIAAVATGVALSACVPFFPSDPAVPQLHVAVRQDGAEVQITFVSCDGERARDVGLLKSKDPNVYNVESDPTVWHVVLPQGSELSTFSIGTTPPSAKEEVSIALPLSQDALYVAEVSGSTGHTYYQAFKLSELGDKIAFDHTYLSPSEFAQRSSCGTPTS